MQQAQKLAENPNPSGAAIALVIGGALALLGIVLATRRAEAAPAAPTPTPPTAPPTAPPPTVPPPAQVPPQPPPEPLPAKPDDDLPLPPPPPLQEPGAPSTPSATPDTESMICHDVVIEYKFKDEPTPHIRAFRRYKIWQWQPIQKLWLAKTIVEDQSFLPRDVRTLGLYYGQFGDDLKSATLSYSSTYIYWAAMWLWTPSGWCLDATTTNEVVPGTVQGPPHVQGVRWR